MGKTMKCMMFGLLLVVVVSSVTLSQSADPFIGTWAVNLAESDFGSSPPKSSTWTIEDRGHGVILYTREAIEAEGDRAFQQFAAKRDGKDYPYLILGAEAPISASVKLVDAYTEETIVKADGKLTETITRTMSEDGSTMTITVKSTRFEGPILAMYERQ